MAPHYIGETALIVRVTLPPALEELRRGAVSEAAHGLPAHVTLLHPFTPAGALDADLDARIAKALASRSGSTFRLAGPSHWPTTPSTGRAR